MKTPWIAACDGTHPKYPFWGFVCLRCGAKECLPTMMPSSDYVLVANAFTALHRECKEAQP
jgi:hypothetical protein